MPLQGDALPNEMQRFLLRKRQQSEQLNDEARQYLPDLQSPNGSMCASYSAAVPLALRQQAAAD